MRLSAPLKSAGGRAPRRFSPLGDGLAEAEPGAEAEDPRAGDFAHPVRQRGERVVGVRADLQPVLALLDEALVEDVEAVRADREAEVTERELLLQAAVEDADVVDPERVRLVRHLHPGEARDAVAEGVAQTDVVGDRIPLAARQVEGEVEAPRTIRSDLVQAV